MSAINALLERFGVAITKRIGTMWCAIFFFALTCLSLPAVIRSHDMIVIVGWLTQTCFQLVLLPIIMVGQKVQAEKTDELVESHAHTHRLLDALHRHHGVEL